MNHFETSWKSTDGIDIFAQGWKPAGKIKVAVCLVHGIGEHTSRYEHVARYFCDQGFAMMGADSRGHGRSAGPRGHFHSAEAILNDIDKLLDETRQRFPDLPLILYGHSLGAIWVLYHSLKRNPDVKGVIATSPGFHNAIEKQRAKVITVKIIGSLLPGILLRSGLDATKLSHNPKVVEDYKNDPMVHDRFSMGLGRIMLAISRWTIENAANFTLPLLMMHGKADAIAFPSGSIDFAKPIKENIKLVLWDGAYHELHNEPEKAEVMKMMTGWMDERIKD